MYTYVHMCVYIYIYIHTRISLYVYVCVYIYIYIYILTSKQHSTPPTKGQHVAHQKSTPQKSSWISSGISNGFPVVFSNTISHFRSISQRIVTCPVDFYWNFPMDFQWYVPTAFHVCDIWCVISAPA